MREIQPGSTITDGESALRVSGRSVAGWEGQYISLSSGVMTGVQTLVEDRDIHNWRHVPFEWTPIEGAGIEERYVWSADIRRLEHEVRGVKP